MTKTMSRRIILSLAGATALCALGHQALLRTQFPGALRTSWDAIATWLVWPALLLAVALIVWTNLSRHRGPKLGSVALQALAAALVGYLASTLLDAISTGIMIREAPLSERLDKALLGALVFAVAFALACTIGILAARAVRGRGISQAM